MKHVSTEFPDVAQSSTCLRTKNASVTELHLFLCTPSNHLKSALVITTKCKNVTQMEEFETIYFHTSSPSRFRSLSSSTAWLSSWLCSRQCSSQCSWLGSSLCSASCRCGAAGAVSGLAAPAEELADERLRAQIRAVRARLAAQLAGCAYVNSICSRELVLPYLCHISSPTS